MVKIKLEDMMKKDHTYAYTVNTGNRFFHSVFERQYFLEVIEIDHDSVGAKVSSVDIVPSGYESNGSNKKYGIHVFTYENLENINDTGFELWKTIIGTVDPDFLEYVSN